MQTVWLLLFIAGHSFGTVPGISSHAECERLYAEMRQARWAGVAIAGENYRCIPYQSR